MFVLFKQGVLGIRDSFLIGCMVLDISVNCSFLQDFLFFLRDKESKQCQYKEDFMGCYIGVF